MHDICRQGGGQRQCLQSNEKYSIIEDLIAHQGRKVTSAGIIFCPGLLDFGACHFDSGARRLKLSWTRTLALTNTTATTIILTASFLLMITAIHCEKSVTVLKMKVLFVRTYQVCFSNVNGIASSRRLKRNLRNQSRPTFSTK